MAYLKTSDPLPKSVRFRAGPVSLAFRMPLPAALAASHFDSNHSIKLSATNTKVAA